MSDEGLLSKGVILKSLLSSHELDEDLDALFEDLCWFSDSVNNYVGVTWSFSDYVKD